MICPDFRSFSSGRNRTDSGTVRTTHSGCPLGYRGLRETAAFGPVPEARATNRAHPQWMDAKRDTGYGSPIPVQ